MDGDDKRLSYNGVQAKRDIVQFVAMRDVETYPPERIAQVLLEEIPNQVTSYMSSRGITPSNMKCMGITPSNVKSNFVYHCLFEWKWKKVDGLYLESPIEKSNVLVIEIGTYESRFGFAGDEQTQVVLQFF